MKLVIVDSLGKAKTIQQYLGRGYVVAPCYGYVRDLPENELGVQLDPPTFEPRYVVRKGERKVIERLRRLARMAEEIILATDADREGEAIAWHLAEVLGLRSPKRIRYTEVTKKALEAALAQPGAIDMRLVEAQQARRILDRLVGYQISPHLRAFGRNHSVGRVQSATLHLIAQREWERRLFQPVPYWTLRVRYDTGLEATHATLGDSGELTETRLPTEEEASALALRARRPHTVTSVEVVLVEQPPPPPFTTSTVLQAASTRLDLRPTRTVVLLQELYEGGFITYYRTDSPALSEDALAMVRMLLEKHDPAALPLQPRRSEAQGSAREGHEALRPTSIEPGVRDLLMGEHRRLYGLIWSQTLASQCRPAVYEQTTVVLTAGDTMWRARAHVLKFDGFLRCLPPFHDSGPERPALPLVPVAQGQLLTHSGISIDARTTAPPPRFTEATLIQEMERARIGRPATYRPTLDALTSRGYISTERDRSTIAPTRWGLFIDEAVENAFGTLVRRAYTGQMEARLDDIADGTRSWKEIIHLWHEKLSLYLDGAGAFLQQMALARPDLVAQESLSNSTLEAGSQ